MKYSSITSGDLTRYWMISSWETSQDTLNSRHPFVLELRAQQRSCTLERTVASGESAGQRVKLYKLGGSAYSWNVHVREK